MLQVRPAARPRSQRNSNRALSPLLNTWTQLKAAAVCRCYEGFDVVARSLSFDA